MCLLMTLMLVPSTALAADVMDSGTWGENITWSLDRDGTLTISGTGAMEDFPLNPESHDAWFYYRPEVVKVVIEDGVTSIGARAFFFHNLETVTIPESVTSIGEKAFAACSSLVSINMPDSIESIGEYAFLMCEKLRDVTISEGLTTLRLGIFEGCDLESVTIPESVTHIDNYAFRNCSSLKSVTFAGTAPRFGYLPFDGVTATVNYPECSGTWTERVKESCGGTLTWEDLGHTEVIDEAVAATCGKTGLTEGSHCSVCEQVLVPRGVIPATGKHSPEAIVTKATLNADGEIAYKCSTCDTATQDSETIYMPKAFSLSYATTSYNGKAKTPYVTVKDSQGNVLEKDKDYSVAYASGCTKVGIYKVTVKGAGNYSFTKTLTFKINPATPALKKTTVGSKKLTVYMTTKPSSKGASTYQIYYKQKGTSKWKSITTTSASKTIKKLKKGKKYYVKVRAYKTVGSTKYYSCWSKTSTSKKVK